eukprot:m.21661 g.21661  ORF g.21661 m.21661 type:complete len:671 (+) comp7200_c0_seq1:218-2230(+)
MGALHGLLIGGVDPSTHEKEGLTNKNSKARGCTDPIFLLLFAVYLLGMGLIARWSLENGNWRLMVYGGDSWGNICGFDNRGKNTHLNTSNAGLDMTDRPHQYFVNPSEPAGMVICVEACPVDGPYETSCTENGVVTEFCKDFCLTNPYTYVKESNSENLYPTNGDECPESVFSTYEAGIVRRCIPKYGGVIENLVGDTVSSYVAEVNAESYFQKAFQSVAAAFPIIGYCVLIAVCLSYILLVMMRCFVRPLIYVILFTGMALLIMISILLYRRYEYYRDYIRAKPENNVLESDERNRDFFEYSSYVMIAFTAIMGLILVALRKEIFIAATIYMESAKVLQAMPTMLLSPFITYAFLITFLAYWIYVLLEMSTTDTPELIILRENVTADGSYGEGHVQYREDVDYWNFWWYHVFGLFWVYQFIMACQEMTLAGCVTSWFKTKQNPPFLALFRMIKFVAIHHLGTIAFGSLIIAFCNLIRAILLYIKEKTAAGETKLAQYIITCCMCCFWCLEKCLKFINRNAYVEVVLYGYSFCNAAWAAFRVVVKNILQVAALNAVGSLIFIVLKLIVTLTVTIIAYYWLKDEHDSYGTIPLWGIVLIIIAIASWYIAEGFTELYEMTADTLLVCFCEDREVNKGKEYLSPPSLIKLLAKHERKKVEPSKEKDDVEVTPM